MRTVIAQIYDYSLDGITPEEGTSFFDFCRELPEDPADVDRTRDFYQNADVLIMGRKHYQGAAQYFPGADDHPYAAAINAARKVVFSRTLRAADWANTSIASGELGAEIENLAGEGTRLFSDLPQPARLEFVSATPDSGGITELVFRRLRSRSKPS
jgi:dihydrofolate reductase